MGIWFDSLLKNLESTRDCAKNSKTLDELKKLIEKYFIDFKEVLIELQ